jgi:transcriptional regulator with XRE-family HTH domain
MNAPEALKHWRTSQGITQADAAERAGVTAPTWFDWENGNKIPVVDKIEELEVITGRAVRMPDWAEYARARKKTRAEEREGGDHG